MALAKLVFGDPTKQPITKKFGAPKKMTLEAWFKAARKMIPEIPDPSKTDWIIFHEEASRDAIMITYELQNTVGDRCKVEINRKVPLIG